MTTTTIRTNHEACQERTSRGHPRHADNTTHTRPTKRKTGGDHVHRAQPPALPERGSWLGCVPPPAGLASPGQCSGT